MQLAGTHEADRQGGRVGARRLGHPRQEWSEGRAGLANDAECLDWLLIVGRGHLEQVLRIYVKHYNEHRPHRALGLEAPDPAAGLAVVGEDETGWVRRRDLLGGLLREYHRAA